MEEEEQLAGVWGGDQWEWTGHVVNEGRSDEMQVILVVLGKSLLDHWCVHRFGVSDWGGEGDEPQEKRS